VALIRTRQRIADLERHNLSALLSFLDLTGADAQSLHVNVNKGDGAFQALADLASEGHALQRRVDTAAFALSIESPRLERNRPNSTGTFSDVQTLGLIGAMTCWTSDMLCFLESSLP
jgi:hypothetical protein